MSEVRIRWTQRVAGRHPGDTETLELTQWVEAVIAAGRAVVLAQDASPVQTPPVEVPVELVFVEDAPKPRRPKPAPPEEADSGEAGPE